MKDITLVNTDCKNDDSNINTERGSYFEPLSSLKAQLDSHNVSYSVINTSVDRIPRSIESNLVMFLDGSFMVKEDYIFNAINLNNLHRDMAIIFGPINCHSKTRKNVNYIKNSYYEYDLNFGSIYTADITGEWHNYGSLYNAVISGSAYNRIGFSTCKTPRSHILNNTAFFRKISEVGNVYYSSVLQKLKILTEDDFQHDKISSYYYDLGYLDGLSASVSLDKEKKDDLWRRFVESPEVIDCNHPRWLFSQSIADSIEYLEFAVVIRCKYQIGYFEGMLGKKLI